MSLTIQRLLNIAMILLSWFSISFLGKRNIKRFFPAAFLVCLICCVDANYAKRRKWWAFHNKPQSFIRDELPFLIGPFFAGSMWSLKLTYGNFKKFIAVNSIMQAIFVSPVTKFCSKLKMYKLVKLNEFQFFLFFFYKAFILYGLQYFFENNMEEN